MEINLTDAARDEIKRQNKNDKGVRIYVASMGWAGPSFALSLEEATSDDIVKDVKDVKFVVDSDLAKRFEAIKVDYGNVGFRRGFKISLEGGNGGGCH